MNMFVRLGKVVSPSSLNSTKIARLAFYCQIPDIWP